MWLIVETFGLATAVIAATSNEERLGIISEFVVDASIGLFLSRLIGGLPASVIFLSPDNYEEHARAQHAVEVEGAWRGYVAELAPQLVKHLRQYDRFLWDCERFLLNWDWHCGSEMRDSALEQLLNEGEEALGLVIRDLMTVPQPYLRLLREEVHALRSGLEPELINDLLR